MNSRREQALVGVFVIVAVGVLVATVLAVSGAFSEKGVTHRAYFKFASGLTPAAPVRYGGLLAGRVEALRVDPQDTTRIEIEFTVGNGIPLKTDSVAKITSLGALGENYLEITTGTKGAPLAPPGSVLKSQEMIGIGDLGDLIGGLAPVASQVLENLNQRLTEMRVTVAEVNDLLSDRNRTNISSGLGTLNSMLVETRPKVGASLDKVSVTLDNVQAATVKLDPVMTNVKMASDRLAPLLDGIQATMKQANDTLTHLDAVVVENRPDIQGAMVDIRKTLSTVSEAVEALRNTLDNNTGNLDDSLANVRASTENLKELTDTLKRKPSALIRGETGKDRKPGDKK